MTSKQSVIGVDMGGTKIDLARYDAHTFALEEQSKIDTHSDQSWPHVYKDLQEAIATMRTDDTIAIGIGVPGLVRQPEGIVVTLPNIPESNEIPLKTQLTADSGLPVTIDNDVNAFTLAEGLHSKYGTKGVVIGIAMGTGVGGGIVVDGELFRGAHGFAAEIGHMLLQPGQPPFETNDKRGDIEQFLSGTAFGKRCEEADRPEEYLEGEVCAFMRPEVFREVAWMCVSLNSLLDPSLIIFGGSAGRALRPHLGEIEKEMQQWSLPNIPLPELAIATLDDAATRGAALLALAK
ncbi:MAG: ROK family protein [Candidatus Peribacteraceae bacterium]|jgi:glucokinase|nr:ROK family protein [Candidatus Peribacteraceae bacterium]MDP7476981.1 ROK family protein [Candidatus Peribacteraceae bacterium]